MVADDLVENGAQPPNQGDDDMAAMIPLLRRSLQVDFDALEQTDSQPQFDGSVVDPFEPDSQPQFDGSLVEPLEPDSQPRPDGSVVQPVEPDSQPRPDGSVVQPGPDSQPDVSMDPPDRQQEQPSASVLKHRANSLKWHQKWISKGVPRVPKNDSVKAAKKDTKKGEKTTANASMASVPDHAAVQSLSVARDRYISEWISKSDLPPSNDRRKAACQAWRESSVRASILASRAGVQK